LLHGKYEIAINNGGLMKIRIDKQGRLLIERGGKLKMQYCRFDCYDDSCNDNCPQFGEPENLCNPSHPQMSELYICNGKGWIGNIEDLRGSEVK